MSRYDDYQDNYEDDGIRAPLGITTALTLSAIIWTILGCLFYYLLNR